MKEVIKEALRVLIAIILIFSFGYFGIKQADKTRRRNAIEIKAKRHYLDSLESAYIFKTKALRIYMPIAIDKNAKK